MNDYYIELDGPTEYLLWVNGPKEFVWQLYLAVKKRGEGMINSLWPEGRLESVNEKQHESWRIVLFVKGSSEDRATERTQAFIRKHGLNLPAYEEGDDE